MFKAGEVVKNKFSNRIGTVTGILDEGYIHVRFDGDQKVIAVHHTHFESCEVSVDSGASKGADPKTFKKGDYIRVTDAEGVMVQGAALHELNSLGLSEFDVLTEDGQCLTFNANHVDIVVLFRADIARGVMPKY